MLTVKHQSPVIISTVGQATATRRPNGDIEVELSRSGFGYILLAAVDGPAVQLTGLDSIITACRELRAALEREDG